jgi:F-type H+-transporting ATPase subunit delta
MKKVTVNQYSEVLYQSTKELSGHELTQALKNYVWLLVKHNNLKLADKIIKRFQQIYNQHEGIEEVEITSHRKLSEEEDQHISVWLKHQLKKTIVLSKKVDENLKGGYIIKYQDIIFDDSLATKLHNLKNNLLK